MTGAVIFVGSPGKGPKNCIQTLKDLFLIAPHHAFFRIFAAFMPPFTAKYKKVYVDLQGPLLALFMLVAFVNYGYSFKSTNMTRSPTEAVIMYSIMMPIFCFMLCKIGRSSITLCEVISLVGYGLYGHILTLVFSFVCFEENSNFFFFVYLTIFGGLSTLRIALVVLRTLVVPAAQLLICSVISVINILFLIFVHFAYMHHTFINKAYSGIPH